MKIDLDSLLFALDNAAEFLRVSEWGGANTKEEKQIQEDANHEAARKIERLANSIGSKAARRGVEHVKSTKRKV